MSQYESCVKSIPYPQERVFAKLEDLGNLESVKERIPRDKVKEFAFDRDSLTIEVPPVGKITLKVIEREVPKCIKFEATGAPVAANFWVQIIPDGEQASKMRVVVKADINFMLRPLIEKPLKEGLEKIAEALSLIEY